MAVSSSLSLSLPSTTLTTNRALKNSQGTAAKPAACSPHNIFTCSAHKICDEEGKSKRRPLLLGLGALSLSLSPASSLFAEEVPKNYRVFVDKADGYSYYYPSDWREFDFTGHDSAFKDRYLQLQNVRLSFIPTINSDIHDLGPIQETISRLVRHVYAAPNQIADIMDIREKTIDGRSYCTFEYVLTSPNFSRAAFATISIGNGRFYTLIVGANERRWRRVRNQLKVVADSFKVLEI